MARPTRNKVDYFPHPVKHGKKMSYLEKKYKNDGYATWFKILEELGNTEYHYLDLSDEVQIMFLSDRCLISETLLIDIINDLIRLKEFDADLWQNNRILFNEKFTDSVKDAYKKRTNEIINKKSLLTLLDSFRTPKLSKSVKKPLKSCSTPVDKPQRIGEDNKVKKRREKRAHEILKNDKQMEYETFMMQEKRNVKNWGELEKCFNDKMDLEVAQGKIEFDAEQLMPRFRGFTRNWITNENHKRNQRSPHPDAYESGKQDRF
ncbi:MAG: hypothetical protein CMD31_00080 [Flavobacteriales bacterium]|nr:hypothetical protein [Flavobacteriales bacterium]|tara:strand:+ start:459 stop:1244 length:786 start_codon:yes stop_codon:yes gene_type:complete